MVMPVMHIREMRVLVRQRLMLMLVGMLGTRHYRIIMRVLMMRIVDMLMVMLHCVMMMPVLMMLGQMQPDPQPHQ